MEHLRYNALKKFELNTSSALFSFWGIFLASLGIIFVLIFLFPKKPLIETLLSQTHLSSADFHYSVLLLQEKDISYSRIQKNPLKAIATFQDALKKDTKQGDPDQIWLNYIILKVLATNKHLPFAVKQAAQKTMVDYFNLFKKEVVAPSYLKNLGEDALEVQQIKYALFFYDKLLSIAPQSNALTYARAGEVAVWAKACEKGAFYYFLAQKQASTLEDKRFFYFKATKTLVQCGQFSLALELADKNIGALTSDLQTYQMLISLAITSNKPAIAQQYLFQFIQLKKQQDSQ